MRGFLAPTDHGWWQFLLARPELDEVNFWRPGGGSFVALSPGEPFLFKLKAPYDANRRLRPLRAVRADAGLARWDVFGHIDL